jgi:CubicO group peptidase (beta-lactamase class C family)
MSKLRMVVCCFILVLLLSLPWATSTATANSDISKTKATTRTEIWKAITGGKTGSAAVAIMDNGVMVYSEGFGAADREQNIPVDRSTVFNISSISKVYCATALMLLVDEGKIELDKPVTAYLPEFTMADERYKDITVRMLLNHSSGLHSTPIMPQAGWKYWLIPTSSTVRVK